MGDTCYGRGMTPNPHSQPCTSCDRTPAQVQHSLDQACHTCNPLPTEHVTTEHLREGDVVWTDGLRVRLDRPMRTTFNGPRTLYTFGACPILNWDDVVARAVRNGRGSAEQFIVSQCPDRLWGIQGTDVRTWRRELCPAAL